MAPTKKNKTANKGRKVKATRKGYPIKIKTFARQLKTFDKLSNSQIKKKIKEKFGMNVPSSTLSTWWNAKNMQIVANMPQDRLNVSDKRINPTQRPDVIVDMETILVRKVYSVKLKGIPYTREMIQFNRLNLLPNICQRVQIRQSFINQLMQHAMTQ